VEILGNNKTAQNRFGQPSYIVLVALLVAFISFYIRARGTKALLPD
jgi:hypothetical protein